MKPPDTSNLIAGIALGVSALALIVSGFMAWRQNRLHWLFRETAGLSVAGLV